MAIILAWLCLAVWLTAFAWTVWGLSRQPVAARAPVPEEQPSVSVIVPARNEADRIIAKSLRTLISQDYDAFEIVVLNDRSTDGTEEIVAGLAGEYPSRLKYVNGAETPNDWLGKPFALHQALAATTGDWILTTDADILFDRATIGSAIARAREGDLDALSLMPGQILGSFWERLFMPVFSWFCLLTMPFHRVNDSDSKVSFGSGNFFLLKRSALERIGGFEAVKNDVAEDLRLAKLLKQNRLRYRIAYAPELISTRMYSGFRETWNGFTKNFFSGMKFSLPRTIGGVFWIFVLGVLPAIAACAAAIAGSWALVVPLLGAYAIQTLTFWVVRTYFRANPLYSFLTPLGFALFGSILVNSAARITVGSGVSWKGRKIYETGGIDPPRI